MATSMPPSQEDFKEQFLTCSLCTELYDNNERQAKCLPCLHSYCKSCIRQHTGRQPRFNCPNCRTVVQLTDGTIDSLPNNFIVESLKEYQDVFNSPVSCGSCEKGHQALGFCHHCGCFLCKGCVDNHNEMRPLRHHQLSTMQELQEEKCNPVMQQRCIKHPTKPLDLYCKNAHCKTPACASCGLIDHRGHEIIDLEAARDEIIADMRRSSTSIAIRKQELTGKRARVDTIQKTLTSNFNKMGKTMQVSVETLHSLIDCRYNKAFSQLTHLYQCEMNRLTEHNKSIDSLAAQMTSACEFANKACDMGHSTHLLDSQDQIVERLYELENTKLPATDSDKTDFILTRQHQSDIGKIDGSLEYLWDVDWLIQPSEYNRGGKRRPKSTSQKHFMQNGFYRHLQSPHQ